MQRKTEIEDHGQFGTRRWQTAGKKSIRESGLGRSMFIPKPVVMAHDDDDIVSVVISLWCVIYKQK